MTTRGFLVLFLLYLLAGCGLPTSPVKLIPPQPGSAAAIGKEAVPHFTDTAKQAGLDYRWVVGAKHPYNILQTIGNGCAFLDYNNDGNLDVLLVGNRLALYRGDGGGHFTNVTREAGLEQFSGRSMGCAVGDYDNDSFKDLYISAYHGGLLLHNLGGKRFQDVTRQSGIQPQPWGSSCAFADIDNDGKLDLYVGNYVKFGPQIKPQFCDFMGHQSACGPSYYKPEYGILYHNEGSGRFRDVTHAWGADKVSGYALGVASTDYDNSGRQSLAIANDEAAGDLLHNLGHRFRNDGLASGTAYDNESHVHAGMGIDWGDYNNDGRPDLVVTTFQHEPNSIYHNDGGGLFTEESAALGIANNSSPYLSFGVKWFDYDNDGWLDLAWANGHVIDVIGTLDKSTSFRQVMQMFHNNQGASFAEVSSQAGECFRQPILGRGLAVGDYDNDGRVDVLVVDSEGPPLLLHNETTQAGHWLGVRLVGSASNRDGYGAMLTAKVGERTLVRQCQSGGSYLSASDPRIHFGLGAVNRVNSLTVRWPSGRVGTYQNLGVDRYITLKEGSS